MPEEEQKPTGGGYGLVDWRLSRIEKGIDDAAKAAVPVVIYNVNQQNIAAEFARIQKAATDEAAARLAGDSQLIARMDASEKIMAVNKDEIAKSRKQFWLSVAAGGLIFVLSLFAQPIARALGVG